MDLARDARHINGRMGYVAQETRLPGSFAVSELVAYSGWLKGMSSSASHRAVGPTLDRLGLSDVAGLSVGSLSGGLQRRVLIAAETVHRPSMLLLDEPFSGVDQESRTMLASELAHLRSDGTVVVVVTHEESDAALLIPDRVVELAHGALLPGTFR